ncbi:MAG: ABC transporter permease [Bryobacteraceae bacterium]
MARRLPGTLFLRNLIERRSLLFQLVRRDFEQRFVGSAMGWIWSLVQPLVQLGIWVFVFEYCLKIKPATGSEGAAPYPLFLFAGILPWMLFSETVQRSASSILDQANLITKTVFPAEIVPLAVFLSTLVSHALALALMVAVAAVVLHHASWFLVLLPVYTLALGLFAVGVAWIVSSLHVFLRDTAQAVGLILNIWFWATPIMIARAQFPVKAWAVIDSNPLSYGVHAYRRLLLTNRLPDAADLAVLTAAGAAVFVLGGLFFRHMKRGFADVL